MSRPGTTWAIALNRTGSSPKCALTGSIDAGTSIHSPRWQNVVRVCNAPLIKLFQRVDVGTGVVDVLVAVSVVDTVVDVEGVRHVVARM